jgi:6-phosphogluconolactonase (cycloisomerase 2 family)
MKRFGMLAFVILPNLPYRAQVGRSLPIGGSMKFRHLGLLSITVLLSFFWAGCEGNGGGGGGRTSGGGGGSGSSSGSFLMISDNANNGVTVAAIETDGTLSNTVNTPVGAQPGFAISSPNGKFGYVANTGSNSINAFSIGTTGTLTGIGIGSFASGANTSSIAINSGGSFMAAANQNSNSVSLYSIDLTGALAALTPATTGVGPRAVAFSGNILYVAEATQIEAFQLSPTLGTLSPLPVTNPAGTDFRALAASGNFLYAADAGTGSVVMFPVNATTGQLGAGTSVGVGVEPVAMTFDSSGKFLYVVNRGDGTVTALSANTATGALTTIGTTTTGGSHPSAVAVDNVNSFVFVANTDSSSVARFTFNTSSGALTSAGIPFVIAGSRPSGLAVLRP